MHPTLADAAQNLAAWERHYTGRELDSADRAYLGALRETYRRMVDGRISLDPWKLYTLRMQARRLELILLWRLAADDARGNQTLYQRLRRIEKRARQRHSRRAIAHQMTFHADPPPANFGTVLVKPDSISL